MKWPTAALSEIAEVRLGRQRSPKNHSGPNNRKYLRAANIGWSGLKLDDVKIMNFTDSEMAIYRLQAGDLLLNEASGSPSEVGKPAIWMGEIEDCAFQNTLLRVRPGTKVDPRYLLQYLRQQASSAAFARGSRGVGIHHLGREALAKWPVPLPPLSEQCRIAAILDHADELRTKRRESAAMYNSLVDAMFVDMFGDPDIAAASGTSVRLRDVADLQGGKNLVADDETSASKFRVLKISAVTTGKFKMHESKPLPVGYVPPAEHLVQKGDLLISRANTAKLVGAVAYVDGESQSLALPDKIWRFVWHDTESVPLYYRSLFHSAPLRRRMSMLATGTGGSMKNISKAKLLDLRVPLVATAEQREFARRLSAIPRPSPMEFDELFASLQSRAFRGEL
ncbi:MAG: restriction endonuclease subunit S [Mycobacterium sp.]